MLKARSYKAEIDLRRMCELVLESDNSTLHAGDLQLKLSDPSMNRREAIRIWEDAGRMVGFAFLHLSGFEFVFETKPCVERPKVESQIIEWALEQLNKVADERRGRDTAFNTNVCEFAAEQISLLEHYGFTRGEEHFVYLHYPLDAEIPAVKLPEGFTVRHLKNASEVPAYVAAHHNSFLFDSLTDKWRRKVLRMPYYIPDLDLIAEVPNGEISAFCFCWLEQNANGSNDIKRGYIQTLGTQHKFQNMGIGQSLFVEALRRLKAFGAKVAVGQTEAGNTSALRLYESAGVRPLHKIYRYFWDSNVQTENKFYDALGLRINKT